MALGDLPDGWTNPSNVLLAGAVGLWGVSVGQVVGIVVHECGHALAGWLAGYALRMVSIGKGKIRFRRRFGRLWIVLRAEAVHGITARLPDPEGRRGAQAVYAAGGPVASALLIVAAGFVAMRVYNDEILMLSSFFLGIALVVSLQLAGALSPRLLRLEGRAGVRRTDGLQLLMLARGEEIDAFAKRYAAVLRAVLGEAEPASPPSALAPELLYQMQRGDLAEPWAQADAAEVVSRLLEEPALSHVERLLIARRFGHRDALKTMPD